MLVFADTRSRTSKINLFDLRLFFVNLTPFELYLPVMSFAGLTKSLLQSLSLIVVVANSVILRLTRSALKT